MGIFGTCFNCAKQEHALSTSLHGVQMTSESKEHPCLFRALQKDP